MKLVPKKKVIDDQGAEWEVVDKKKRVFVEEDSDDDLEESKEADSD